MLRTNSKKVREAIRDYIKYNTTDYDYDEMPADFETAREIVKNSYYNEVGKWLERSVSRYEAFETWTQGLPSTLNCSYYLSSAVELLGDILEETQAERERFTETEAEKLMTKLIYRELF